MFCSQRLRSALALAPLFVGFAIDREADAQVMPGRPSQVHAPTMSLREMTDAADVIFEGRVARVGMEDIELRGKDNRPLRYRVNVVTFDVTRKIKGNVEVGRPLVVRQIPSASVPLAQGEEVLWYLARPGRSGLTAPLGMYSGHFKIKADPEQPRAKTAVNLVDNRGLWSPTAPLLQPQGNLDRAQLATILERRRPDLPVGQTQRILALASQPNRPGPLPLELITSATESLLAGPAPGAPR